VLHNHSVLKRSRCLKRLPTDNPSITRLSKDGTSFLSRKAGKHHRGSDASIISAGHTFRRAIYIMAFVICENLLQCDGTVSV
jgi:hypothetical protein